MADVLVVLRAGTPAAVAAKIIDVLVEHYPGATARGVDSVQIALQGDERYLLVNAVVVEAAGAAPMGIWADSDP